jgi:hypothetical protein
MQPPIHVLAMASLSLIMATPAMAQQPSGNSAGDAQQYPGPAPWVQPVALLSNAGENRIFSGRPQQSEPNNPTIWMWIYARPTQGVGTRAPDGGDGKYNIIAQHFRINCRSRTTQSLYVQTFWWEGFFEGDPRSVLSTPQNVSAQPTTPGTPADYLVTAACDPASIPQSGSNSFPSAWMAMRSVHRLGN